MPYLIMGITGEAGDTKEWSVTVFLNKEKAEYWCDQLQKEIDRWIKQRNSEYEQPPQNWSKLDKNMKCDYTGTEYFIVEVPIMY